MQLESPESEEAAEEGGEDGNEGSNELSPELRLVPMDSSTRKQPNWTLSIYDSAALIRLFQLEFKLHLAIA